jgi:hypothetical protein
MKNSKQLSLVLEKLPDGSVIEIISMSFWWQILFTYGYKYNSEKL